MELSQFDMNFNDLEFDTGNFTSENMFNFSMEEVLAIFNAKDHRLLDPYFLNALIVIYTILMVTGMFTNTMVWFAVARSSGLRTPRNFYVVNLTVSDMTLCLISMPFTLINFIQMQWNLGMLLCKLVPMVQGTNIFVSTLTVEFIALDRYFTIVRSRGAPQDKYRVLLTIALIWIVSCFFTFPILFYQVLEEENIGGLLVIRHCIEKWPSSSWRAAYTFGLLVFQLVIPILVLVGVHIAIANHLNAHTASITNGSDPNGVSSTKRLLKKSFLLRGRGSGGNNKKASILNSNNSTPSKDGSKRAAHSTIDVLALTSLNHNHSNSHSNSNSNSNSNLTSNPNANVNSNLNLNLNLNLKNNYQKGKISLSPPISSTDETKSSVLNANSENDIYNHYNYNNEKDTEIICNSSTHPNRSDKHEDENEKDAGIGIGGGENREKDNNNTSDGDGASANDKKVLKKNPSSSSLVSSQIQDSSFISSSRSSIHCPVSSKRLSSHQLLSNHPPLASSNFNITFEEFCHLSDHHKKHPEQRTPQHQLPKNNNTKGVRRASSEAKEEKENKERETEERTKSQEQNRDQEQRPSIISGISACDELDGAHHHRTHNNSNSLTKTSASVGISAIGSNGAVSKIHPNPNPNPHPNPSPSPIPTVSSSVSKRTKKELARNRRTTIILLSVAVIFTISWMPWHLLTLWADLHPNFMSTSNLYMLYAICHIIAMTSAITNAILYGWFNTNLRRELLQMLSSWIKR